MFRGAFEPTIPVFDRAKRGHCDRIVLKNVKGPEIGTSSIDWAQLSRPLTCLVSETGF
jgi:hypothetical protein